MKTSFHLRAKRFFVRTVLAAVMAIGLVSLAPRASAQFVMPPAWGSLFTNAATVPPCIIGSTTSNLPTTMVRTFTAGAAGVGIFVRIAGTNAATTTNATMTLEMSIDGTSWIDTTTPVVSIPQNGTAGYDTFTNIVSTSANTGNTVLWRAKSIQNTNLASIFITNAYWVAR